MQRTGIASDPFLLRSSFQNDLQLSHRCTEGSPDLTQLLVAKPLLIPGSLRGSKNTVKSFIKFLLSFQPRNAFTELIFLILQRGPHKLPPH